MSVYKEGYKALEIITGQARQVWNDSCDYGTPTTEGDSIWNTAKQLVDTYGKKETREVFKYSTGITVNVIVELIDEWAVSDERKTLEQARERFIISFVGMKGLRKIWKNKPRPTGYITVNQILTL